MNKEYIHLMPVEFRKEKSRPDVLFINVPSTFKREVIPADDEPSFGLLRVATVMELKGYKPAILDAQRGGLNLNQIKETLTITRPTMVGLNPTSVNVPVAQDIAEVCNSMGIPVVLGGVHATLSPFDALKKDFPQSLAVVKGKGEIPMPLILEGWLGGKRAPIGGVYYQDTESGRADFADVYPLDQLPIIQQHRYVEDPTISRQISFFGKLVNVNEAALYVTAGCPFQCTFCATPNLVGEKEKGIKPYFRPEMTNILASVRFVKEILGANAVHFVDDLAFITKDHYLSFIQGLEKMWPNERFYWRTMARASQIDMLPDETLEKIAHSGCWRITMGIESGNDEILKRIRKGITKDQVKRSVVRLRKAGIGSLKGFFIMGFPGETEEQIFDTQGFILELKSLGLTDISVFQFVPWPGSGEWQRLKQMAPEVLKRLNYLRSVGSGPTQQAAKKMTEMFFLPPDICIAKVPGGTVEEIVRSTISLFYGRKRS